MDKKDSLVVRDQISEEYKWDLSSLYQDDKAWEEEFKEVATKVAELASYKGKLKESAEGLFTTLDFSMGLSRKLEKLYTYAARKSDEDTANNKHQALQARIQSLYSQYASEMSFVVPEIIQIPNQELDKFIRENSNLTIYQHYLDEIIRQKEHYLSPEEERIIALSSEVSQGAEEIFGMINDADINFPRIKRRNGEEIKITHGRYIELLKDNDRNLRKDAFKAYYSSYENLKNTIAMTLSTNVKANIFYAKARKYNSAIESSLDANNIPVSVYDNLLEVVNQNLDSMHKYVDLRKKALDLEQLHIYDIYTPIIKDVEMKISYEEGKEIILKALEPLGQEYIEIVKDSFKDSWIDVYENKGKRSGAYSASCYDGHPYILLNYNNSIDDLFTLAHELGHAMHSYYSNKKQPYIYADYSIFVAEVASTVNEALLMQYLLENTDNPEQKKYIINHYLEQFRGTVYRQAMFAEYERMIHEMVESGEALTSELLSKRYYELNRKYYGNDIILDEEIGIEWARIPHFYYNFYVYQYATGFSAAVALSQKILEEGEEALNRYLEFLQGGSSKYPIDLLNDAGVDMTDSAVIQSSLDIFAEMIKEMEGLLLA